MKYEFPTEMSLEVQDLINRLLQYDPTKRISLENVLKHEWIIKHVKINDSNELYKIVF